MNKPAFPEHIVNMALAILNGQEAEAELHDALLELGLYKTAHHFSKPGVEGHQPRNRGLCNVCIGLICADSRIRDLPGEAELLNYLQNQEKFINSKLKNG